MPILFNSVTQFVEQVGRRREHKSKPTELDTLDCVFTGPQSKTSTVCPADLATHPEFPGMDCTGWSVIDKEALVAEVRAQYTGKLLAGSGPYTTPPLITTARHLGSVSYTANTFKTYFTPIISPGSPPTTASETEMIVTSYTTRFSLKSVTFKYLTNRQPAPDFDGMFSDKAAPYLGYENLVQFITAISFGAAPQSFISGVGGGTLTQSLVFENDLTNLAVDPLGNGWWSVDEEYTTQALINSRLI